MLYVFNFFTTPPILLYAHPFLLLLLFLLLFNSVVFPGLARTADEGLRVETFFVHVMILNYLLRKLSNSFIVIIRSNEPLLHHSVMSCQHLEMSNQSLV